MNKKTFHLFKKLILSDSKPLQLDDMSAFFHVGTRTLYNYWDEICDYLIKLDLREHFSFDGKEFKCRINEEMKQYLITSLRTMSFYEYKLSSSERQAIMSVIFLISNAPIRSSDFNDILCVSQNTIITDLKEVKKLLDSFHIQFHENKYHGFAVKCSETDRRNLLLKIFDDQNIIHDYFINTPSNPCISYICNYMKLEKYRYMIESIVEEAEDKINIHMTDYDFYKVVIILLIITVRNQADFPILYTEENTNTKSYGQLTLFTECIFHKLGTLLTASYAESLYFVNRMQHYKIVSEKPSNTYNEVLFSLVIKEFLTTVSKFYKYDLLGDTALSEYLNAHISVCYNRLKKNIVIENPYLSEIKRKYRQDFQFLKEHIYILENALHISFNDGEIAYILMHILATLEKDRNNMDSPNVVVICHGGIATSNYLSTQLNHHFRLNIMATCSIHNAKSIIEEYPIDLIISTMPIKEFDIPTVVVNALLMEEDIYNLHEKLSQIQKHQANQSHIPPDTASDHSLLSLRALLSLDRIVLDKEVLDWKEAIISAGELLLWDRLISVNYLHTMIDLVVKYGAYIVIAPHIALAHAAPSDGAKDSGVSIVRLKEPVKFGKEKLDPVKVVVACSFLDTTDNANILLKLMRTILKPNFLSTAMAAKTPQEILDYFE
ncbi:MAG: PTS sugar transporter subunit IIA [Eubacteriales bacterium]|nr:PTS sugar transporter subunit IIA [Eubacteriales bacterium]